MNIRNLLIAVVLVFIAPFLTAGKRFVPWKTVVTGGATTASDNFNRADEQPLSNGGMWATPPIGYSNPFKVVSNVAGSAGGDTVAYVVSPDFTATANQSATATLTTAGLASYSGVCVRMNSLGNGYILRNNGNATTFYLYRITGGSSGEVAIQTWSGLTLIAGDTITLSITGTTLTAKQNSTTVGTATDVLYSSGSPGIYVGESASTVDNFTATSL